MKLSKTSIAGISLDAAGLVALADLTTIAEHTAFIGTVSFLDVLLLAPGIHRQQEASKVNGGELPITGAMTSGYVFRVENPAMVRYLQRVGRPGCLTTVEVSPAPRMLLTDRGLFYGRHGQGIAASVCYLMGVLLTITAISVLGVIHDYWAVGVLLMLIVSRFLNMVVLRRRARMGWKGASEPGKHGDLLVLLSQDRWVRIRGLVDDLKAVTAGEWLREQTTLESFATALGTLLVYVGAALASNASNVGSLFIAVLLLLSVTLLGLCNSFTRDLHLFNRRVSVIEGPKAYERRLIMAEELIKTSGRDDWAVGMGLIHAKGNQKEVQV